MSNLKLVNSFDAGASFKVCQMGSGKKKYPFDHRGYAISLSETGYPLLPQWIDGDWGDDSIAEYCRMTKDAIVRGSFPMLAVVAIGSRSNPAVWIQTVSNLSPQLKSKLRSLIKIGSANNQYGSYIKKLSDV